MDIYTSAAALLFVNSISNYVGLFFKMWVRDSGGFGLRLLQAETHYRSHFEIISKSVMLSIIGGVWYNCIHQWERYTFTVVIFHDYHEMWHDGMKIPGLAMIYTLIVLSFLSLFFDKMVIIGE